MRMLEIEPAASSDFLCTIEMNGEPVLQNVYFSTFSGVEHTATRPEFTDGLSNVRRIAQTGSLKVSDVTLTKPFDPDRDGELISWIERTLESGDHFQGLIRPVRRAGEIEFRGQRAFRLANCRIMAAAYPGAVDTSAGDSVATVSITASVESAKFA